MILDAYGRPIHSHDEGPTMRLLNERTRELSASMSSKLVSLMLEQTEMERVARFRRVNGLPVEYHGGSFLDESLTWDGASYAKYGDLKS